jgi:hypothetical protein
MNMSIWTAALFIAFSLCPFTVVCQSKASDLPNGYAIRITRHEVSSINPMFGPELRGGFTITVPSELVIKPPTTDSERVSLLSVSTVHEMDLWRIEVSLTFGEFHDKGQKQVAVYRVSEGETAKIRELVEYGLDPLEFSVVKVDLAAPIQPEVVNRTNSIAVLSVEANALPSEYRIILKNISDKDIYGLEITSTGGQGGFSLKWPSGQWDHPLIEAGREYKTKMPSGSRYRSLNSTDYVPEQSPIIEINSVVFTDGTYEGKPYPAAIKRAEDIGHRQQLDKVLSLIDAALVAANTDSAIGEFKAAVSSLDIVAGSTSLDQIESEFPTLNADQKRNLMNSVRGGLHVVKRCLTLDIAELERGPKQTSNSASRHWLEKEKEKYERWRSKLP